MQSYRDVDMNASNAAPAPAAPNTSSRLLNTALGSVTAAKKQRPSPYDRRAQDPKDRWTHDKYADEHGGSSGGGGRLNSSSSHHDLRASSHSHISPKLKVEGLHYEITEMDLRELFSSMGALAQPPEIKYDRSGRSTGVAFVIFKDAEDAASAKMEFDGQHARGEPISVSFEAVEERKGRKSEGAGWESRGGAGSSGAGGGPGGKKPLSLLQRVEGRDLLSRLDAATSNPKPNARRGPNTNPAQPNQPQRAVSSNTPRGPSSGGSSRSTRGPGGAGGRGGAPKSANDLDAELDAFMKTPATAAMAQSIHAPKAGPDGDIDMQ
ncbi:hypothetical protein CF327_g1305 [Tilletia walkeri]|nr:hypothetical protein CF327_g1305 [Tilletia walkeri]